MDDNFWLLLLLEILWYSLRASVLISFATYIYLKIFRWNVWWYDYNDFWYLFIITGVITLIIQFFVKD